MLYSNTQSTSLLHKLFMVFVALVLVLVLAAFLEPVLRYSYQTNLTYGHTLRTDRLTGKSCFYSGPKEVHRAIALTRCE